MVNLTRPGENDTAVARKRRNRDRAATDWGDWSPVKAEPDGRTRRLWCGELLFTRRVGRLRTHSRID